MTGLRVPFGMRGERLFEPHQVENGGACCCVCPECKHPLIARQNASTPHFAHAPGADCAHGFETAIHLAAKQLIEARMELHLPEMVVRFFDGRTSISVAAEPQRLVKLKSVCQEKWMGDIRPDVLATVDGAGLLDENEMEILIEIAVTHFVDEEKMGKIIRRGISAVEVDASGLKGKINFAGLELLLFKSPHKTRWLYHPRAEALRDEYYLQHKAERQKEEAQKAEREKERTERLLRYKNMAPNKKLAINLKKARIESKYVGKLTSFVPGERSFLVPRKVWQTSVLAYIAKEVDDSLIERDYFAAYVSSEEIVDWLVTVTEFKPEFPDAEKIAVWKYLKYLESVGLVKWQSGKIFNISEQPCLWRPPPTNK